MAYRLSLITNTTCLQMGDPIQLKEEGNKYFQAGDVDKAIECYSNAIKLCKDKKVLAVIFRNRSACYLKKVNSLASSQRAKVKKCIQIHSSSSYLTGKLRQCSIRCI